MIQQIINFNNKINIIGLDYLSDTNIVIEKLKNLLRSRENNFENRRPNILLNHVPIFNAKELENYDIFLFLCGHYHGGHFFPFTLLNFVRDKFILKDYIIIIINIMCIVIVDKEHLDLVLEVSLNHKLE